MGHRYRSSDREEGSSSRFLRPGEGRKSAFGVSFQDVERRGSDNASSIPIFNRYRGLRIEEQQRLLPIFKYKREILYLVEKHATCIIVGETGSGKTTQVPQYLYSAGWAPIGSMIACTQPRRVAAMSVAARVAEEMNVELGQEVGFAIRFEDVSSHQTRIKFCTDGVLIKEMATDPLLSKYSVIMVDEAHERSASTDVLLGLLKKIQKRRPSLRIVISSATIDAERFASFFFDASTSISQEEAHADRPSGMPGMLSVQGRTHSVQVHYLERPCQDYVQTSVETVYKINDAGLPGDILVFLTGQEECDKAVSLVQESNHSQYTEGRSQRRSGTRLYPVALYSGLSAKHQMEVFESPPRNCRKVVFATNIAETSVTIDGIVHVVDCMFSKQRNFDPFIGLESLLVAPISKASAVQRSGRAGRVRPGFSYRLCTQEHFENLDTVEIPELQRSDLTSIVLQLKGLGVDNMLHFSWLTPPPSECMVRSLENLHALGALGDDAKLTQYMGRYMSEISIEPQLSRALLVSWSAGCVYEVATISAMLNVQSIWASGRRRDLDGAKSQFAVEEGDLITYLNVWKAWEENKRSKSWAIKNFVSHRCLIRASDIRDQVLRQIIRLKKQSSPDDPIFCRRSLQDIRDNILLRKDLSREEMHDRIIAIQKSLAAGLFLNSVQLRFGPRGEPEIDNEGNSTYRFLRNTGDPLTEMSRLRIHPSSVMYGRQPQWLCFYMAQQTGKHSVDMQEVHCVKPEWLAEAAPYFFNASKKKTI